ncbi:hypothetical protein UFOVP583_29 [uncultured Caudovirales phage]|uniref:Uncharacterized protein n=1 Tax=uncultured Caudovirales phage TaxID=2100421 RepID=A0A6J5N0N5_9CAUD|nr:hypothetical protein UFOVP583_29 [uncultured Caudovirales phage]
MSKHDDDTCPHLVRASLLESENARLKAEVERLQNNCDYLDRELDREIEKTAMLCGQVERLRKAGDALVGVLKDEDYNTEPDEYCMEEVVAWNAAKEGKPSV